MILVTGATGFIGRRLVSLLLQRGDRVRALMRAPSASPVVPRPGLEIAIGDVADEASVTASMRGCSAVVHLATPRERAEPDTGRLQQTIVGGSRSVMEAALRAGVRSLVHVSTARLLGPSSGRPRVEEDLPPRAASRGPYLQAKHAADAECRRLIAEGLPAVVVYPTFVFGAGQTRGESRLGDLARQFASRRFVPVIGSGTQVLNFVYVDDVAAGLVLALDRGCPGEAYILGGEDASLRQVLALLVDLTGHRPRRLPVPVPLVAGAAKIAGAFSITRRLSSALALGVAADLAKFHWAASSEKARVELGYEWRSLRQGLCDTLQ